MSHPHLLTWLYRKLWRRYPAFFITVELQSAFLIATGAVALFSFYYDVSSGDFLKILAITLGLTAVGISFTIVRVLRRLQPLTAWIGGARSSEETAEAWHAAVNLPILLIRRDFLVPVLVTVITVIASVAVLDLTGSPSSRSRSPPCSPSPTGRRSTTWLSSSLCGRSSSTSTRASRFRSGSIARSCRCASSCSGSLPLINVITGLVVAALTSNGGGTDALGINVLIALFVSFTISFELTVLLSRSILRPIEDLEAATERIRQGRFDEHVPVTTSDEFGELSSAFNQMVDGLAERERLRAAFGTYLDEEVAQHLISEDFEPHGEEVGGLAASSATCAISPRPRRSPLPPRSWRGSTSSSSASSRSSPATGPHRPVHRRRGARRLRRARAHPAARRPRGAVRGGDRPDHQQPPPGRLRGGRRSQLGQRRRRRDRWRRPAVLQRHRRCGQPLLPGGGRDPRDRGSRC